MNDSVFNLQVQNSSIDNKIVVALERISEAFRVLLWEVGKPFGLSPIQIQLLIFVASHKREYAKISYLAKEFNVTKPTVSDSIKVLEQKGFLRKNTNEKDGRSYSLELTIEGQAMIANLSSFANIFKPIPISNTEKSILWQGLLNILDSLQKVGIVSLQRMCFSCVYYQSKQESHFCHLLQTTLQSEDIRIDCPEHLNS